MHQVVQHRLTFGPLQFSLCLKISSLGFQHRLTFGIKSVELFPHFFRSFSFFFQAFSFFFQARFGVIGAFPFSAYHNFVVTSFHSGNGEAQQYGLSQDLVVDVPRDGAGVA